MLTQLASGYQLVNWPSSWDEYLQFRNAWGLADAMAIRLLALGWWSERELDLRLWIISGRRSREEQARLYDEYRSGRSSLPAAAPGTSAHERGLAADVASDRELTPAEWADVHKLADRLGLRGVHYDPPHFQLAVQ